MFSVSLKAKDLSLDVLIFFRKWIHSPRAFRKSNISSSGTFTFSASFITNSSRVVVSTECLSRKTSIFENFWMIFRITSGDTTDHIAFTTQTFLLTVYGKLSVKWKAWICWHDKFREYHNCLSSEILFHFFDTSLNVKSIYCSKQQKIFNSMSSGKVATPAHFSFVVSSSNFEKPWYLFIAGVTLFWQSLFFPWQNKHFSDFSRT